MSDFSIHRGYTREFHERLNSSNLMLATRMRAAAKSVRLHSLSSRDNSLTSPFFTSTKT